MYVKLDFSYSTSMGCIFENADPGSLCACCPPALVLRALSGTNHHPHTTRVMYVPLVYLPYGVVCSLSPRYPFSFLKKTKSGSPFSSWCVFVVVLVCYQELQGGPSRDAPLLEGHPALRLLR